MDEYIKHIRIATERASTNPEVATANALAAIAILLANREARNG